MIFLHLLMILAVIGVLLYLFNTLVPMQAGIKTAINALVLLGAFLYILHVFGIVGMPWMR